MAAKWFKIFNIGDWVATGLAQRTLTFDLEGFGQQQMLVTEGNATSVLYGDKMLVVDLNDANPYIVDDAAIYRDGSDDVWLGLDDGT